MTALINSLGKLFGTTWDYLRSLFDWAVRTGASVVSTAFSLPAWVTNAIAYCGALASMLLGLIDEGAKFVVSMISRVLEGVGAVNPSSFNTPSVPLDVLAGINTFFPLQELFGFLVAYFALLLVCASIRMVKAWIPTVS